VRRFGFDCGTVCSGLIEARRRDTNVWQRKDLLLNSNLNISATQAGLKVEAVEMRAGENQEMMAAYVSYHPITS
jgi:hypothetical protein